VTFEPARLHHALELAPRLRAGDAAEVRASDGVDAEEALVDSLRWTERHGGGAFAGFLDGDLAALFGVARRSLISPVGVPWLLTGEVVSRHPFAFFRASRAVVATWLEDFEELEQNVDARYTEALRWAARLGFMVGPPKPFGVHGLPFHRITLRRS